MTTDLSNTPSELQTFCCPPTISPWSDSDFEVLADTLQMLAHPIRLKIISMLACTPEAMCVCDIEEALPIKQPTVSHHLKLLRASGLISAEKRGLFVYYTFNREAVSGNINGVIAMLGL